jgi:hypothetical protein
MFYLDMTDRPASWRMPTLKQMEKMAAAVDRKAPPARGLASDEELPREYWQALLTTPAPTRVLRTLAQQVSGRGGWAKFLNIF